MSNETTDELEAHYDRITFGLTYRYEPTRRPQVWGLSGKDIPNAYAPTGRKNTAPGEWTGDIDDWEGNPYLQTFANAINEAVHEALEWVKVDGKAFLDPHGLNEGAIFNEVNILVSQLWELVDKEAHGIPEEFA